MVFHNSGVRGDERRGQAQQDEPDQARQQQDVQLPASGHPLQEGNRPVAPDGAPGGGSSLVRAVRGCGAVVGV